MANPETPYYIQIRGCINCDASKALREKIGHDYGFDHEIMVGCILRNCSGHDLLHPYFDPAEIARLAKKLDDPRARINARKICLTLKRTYGRYYDELGIPIDNIINDLEK